MKTDLTWEEAAKVIDYDPLTGEMARKDAAWHRARNATTKSKYATISINGQSYQQHRIAWLLYYKCWPSGHIDHIDGNGKNNAIANLRDVTQVENANAFRKLSCKNTTGYRNVTYDKHKEKYIATKMYYGISHFLGSYDTAEEAAQAVATFNATKKVPRVKFDSKTRPAVSEEFSKDDVDRYRRILSKITQATAERLKDENFHWNLKRYLELAIDRLCATTLAAGKDDPLADVFAPALDAFEQSKQPRLPFI